MNIVFTTRKISVGGVAIVTIILANELAKRGHQVSIFGFMEEYDQLSYDMISPAVHVYLGNKDGYSKYNVQRLKQIFEKEKPDIVINQWGLHWYNITCIRKALGKNKAKVFTVYHSDPITNGRIQQCDIALQKTSSQAQTIMLRIKRLAFKLITGASMRYVYSRSDSYFVLSKSYTDNFKKVTRVSKGEKLKVLPNPITIPTSEYRYNPNEKQKEIVFVGRLDNLSKRVNRIIDVWRCLEDKFPDWRLIIVGDGPDASKIKEQARAYGLRHISFEGFKSPIAYYQRASILLLTSEFEGFPLVLAEAMSLGVIPCVYDSFSAAHDIIEHGKNGLLIASELDASQTFSAEKMAKVVEELINSPQMMADMATQAIQKSKSYSPDTICSQWEALFVSNSTPHA